MKLGAETWGRIRTIARDNDARVRARELRRDYPDDLADEDAVFEAVREADAAARDYGLDRRDLRERFVRLGIVTAPRFWADPTLHGLLRAGTGTPEMRFGDVCAMLRLAARRAGRGDEVWW